MHPKNETELAEMIKGATSPIRIVGGGTRPIGRTTKAQTLTTSAMTGIVLHEPGALTLVVKAGTSISEIEVALAKEGQRLAFEPMDHRALLGTTGEPTIGGAVAANVSGPRRISLGACRDFLLGVRFVDGQGRILKNGGRVMKNVTGYDLVKLMSGSFGTLGVLTEVSLKVLATPKTEKTLVCKGLDATAAVASLTSALSSPFDVTGASHAGFGKGETLIRIEGLPGSVDYRSEALLARLGGDWKIVEGDESRNRWREVRDVTAFAETSEIIWKLSVKPSDGPMVVEALRAQDIDAKALFDWGGGLVWLSVPSAIDPNRIRNILAGFGGHATLMRGPDDIMQEVSVFHPQHAAIEKINAQLRAKFDPRGLFNPGLMG